MVDLKKKTKISKTELTESVAHDLHLSKREVTEVSNSLFDKICQHLKNGRDVTIMDFGSFRIQEIKARKGRNPHTGEEVVILPHKRVKFKPGKKLSAAVSKKT